MLIEKMLQSQGFGSRKYCQQLIKNGQVEINGELITELKQQIQPAGLHFSVMGREYQYQEKLYIALNKPAGYECSHQATHHFSVFDLLDELFLNRGIQAVGRLDQDTTGILLFTDDGQLIQALTHPKKHVPKVYQMTTRDVVTAEQIEQLQQGVSLKNEKGVFAATDVQCLDSHRVQFAVHQGVYHQVKRMLAAVGNQVEQLHRLQMGQLQLQHLAEGEWCYLTEKQIQAARNQLAEQEIECI